MKHNFNLLKQKVKKEMNALDEDFNLEDYINPKLSEIKVSTEPFEHVILDNFFKEDFYKDICSFFDSIFEKGYARENNNEKFHPFLDVEYPYDGYVKSIFPFENKVCDFIYSNQFNLFLSKIFNRPTSTTITPAFHFHEPHDKTGWVHNDYAKKNFSSRNVLYNGILSHSRYGSSNKNDIIEKRAIALIYYFDNDLSEKDGGGTGLYKHLKSEKPAIVVEPVNNRALIFSVSPLSYHAFQQNLKNRKSIVLWLHVDENWCKENLEKKQSNK